METLLYNGDMKYEESAWRTRLAESDEFSRFRTIQTELKPSALWSLDINRPSTLELCTYVVKLVSSVTAVYICQSCNSVTNDIIHHHHVCECSNVGVNLKRMQFRDTVSSKLGSHTSTLLWNLQDEELLVCLLGGPNHELQNALTENEYYEFLSISVRFISSLSS